MGFYVVDLTSVKGNGEIRCPKCGTEISPDDETDEVFTIMETVMKGDNLEKLILKCNKCKSQIHLTGFEFLEKAST
jgi:hypothetical protein